MTRAGEFEDTEQPQKTLWQAAQSENDQAFEFINSGDSETEEDDEVMAADEKRPDDSENQDTVSLGGSFDLSAADPFTSNPYELIVVDGRCSFSVPVRPAPYKPVNPKAKRRPNNPSTWIFTYKALAEWLNKKNTSSFLESRDLWDLGPAKSSELKQGCSVIQEDLVGMLGLGGKNQASSFCRFLDRCELVWPDGVAPVRVLFSHEAKLAWVARAVTCFATELGQPLTEEVLNTYADIQGPKGKMKKPSRRCDVPTFIKYANNMAGTAWKDVLESPYRDKMLHPPRQ